MGNCLLTKLKDVVDNPSMTEYHNAIVVTSSSEEESLFGLSKISCLKDIRVKLLYGSFAATDQIEGNEYIIKANDSNNGKARVAPGSSLIIYDVDQITYLQFVSVSHNESGNPVKTQLLSLPLMRHNLNGVKILLL